MVVKTGRKRGYVQLADGAREVIKLRWNETTELVIRKPPKEKKRKEEEWKEEGEKRRDEREKGRAGGRVDVHLLHLAEVTKA